MAMDDFFSNGKWIEIKTGDGESVELYIRYLKVKDLPEYYRIADIEDELAKVVESLSMLERMVGDTVDGISIEDLPADAVFEAFEEMNFFGPEDGGEGAGKVEVNRIKNFDITFDFLISQGHTFDAIINYTVPRYLYLLTAAGNRVFGKTKKKEPADPFDFFSKAGIKMTHK